MSNGQKNEPKGWLLPIFHLSFRMPLVCFRVDCRVPTYIYETTDPAKPVRTFLVKQSVQDDPLCADPATGEAARRIISAGYSILVPGKSVGPSVGSVGS